MSHSGADPEHDEALDELVEGGRSRIKKAPNAFRTISEVADELHIPQHVLRFWETKFQQVKPLKRGGGRRYYRPDDIALLRRISDLLYIQGYTIKGVQRLLREGGGKLSDDIPPAAPDEQEEAAEERAAPVPDRAGVADARARRGGRVPPGWRASGTAREAGFSKPNGSAPDRPRRFASSRRFGPCSTRVWTQRSQLECRVPGPPPA